MGKNKSKRKMKTDWAVRTSALRKADNQLSKQKQSEHKAKGN